MALMRQTPLPANSKVAAAANARFQRQKPYRLDTSRSGDVVHLLVIPDSKADVENRPSQRQIALSVWDNEGGRICRRRPVQSNVPYMVDTELTQLRIRVIALENLVIALLADQSDRQLDLAREMAVYISPRLGRTLHPLTINAAAQMFRLVERAGDVRINRSC